VTDEGRWWVITNLTNLYSQTHFPSLDYTLSFHIELCGGESKKALRQYMKLVGKETWQLVNWLTHHRNANAASSIIASQACSTLIGHSIELFDDHLPNRVEHCPHCRSRNVRSHFDHRIEPDGQYFWTCGACGWSNHPTAANLG
jgi:hypothetical protein